MTTANFIKEFKKNLEALRHHPDQGYFRHQVHAFQADLLFKQPHVLRAYFKKNGPRALQDLVFRHPLAGSVFQILEHTPGKFQSHFIKHLVSLDPKQQARVIEEMNRKIKDAGYDWSEKISQETQKMLRKIDYVKGAEVFFSPQSVDQSQILHPMMHYTIKNRHEDSNMILNETFKGAPGLKRAAFIGGSIGYVADDFLRTMKHSSWKVLSMDLFSPNEMAQRLGVKEGVTVDAKDISFLKGDMKCLPFRKNHFDFIDVCNVIGYLDNLNDRLRVVRNLWACLKEDGIMRLVTPGRESVFEQAMFRKRGQRLTDFELVYVSMTGKSKPKHMSAPELREMGQKLTDSILRIRRAKRIKIPAKQPLLKTLLRDIKELNPLGFGAGLYDRSRMILDRNKDGIKSTQRIYRSLATLLKLIHD